ncbi:acyltransferase family protein [Kineococcus auxinigenes]|uniref:acyltransferase family protein n=1 Tax=unclassified Kineococcus TaxID=2621656 RepID=UPI003D7D3870
MPTSTGLTAHAPRLAWVDTARGGALLLVIAYHAVLLADSIGLGSGPWHRIVYALGVARMPLFFFLSGMRGGPRGGPPLGRPAPRTLEWEPLALRALGYARVHGVLRGALRACRSSRRMRALDHIDVLAP